MRGRNGRDTINGDAGDDLIEGNNGNDVIDGGSGIDVLFGMLGADLFFFDGLDSDSDFDDSEGDLIGSGSPPSS